MTKDIHTDFQNAQGRSILFLGRYTSLSEEEIRLFLERFGIHYTDTLDDDVAMVVESTIVSPLEEALATEAYARGLHLYSTDQFDRLYAQELNSDSILMSLKLSNNQERLSRLLHNRYLSDALFIRLFSMYDWGGEGMFDNSENMKIATLFAKRFFTKSRFDAATYHSPISVFEVAALTENPDLLAVMFDLPEIEIKQSRSGPRKPIRLKEAIAANPHTPEATLTRLFRRNDPAIDYFLAQNPATPYAMQERIYDRSDEATAAALCKNPSLSPALFARLTDHDILWEYQPISRSQLALREDLPACIGDNEQLSPDAVAELIADAGLPILENLAMNPILTAEQLRTLYARGDTALYPAIAANPNTPTEILEALFAMQMPEVDRHLALNSATPQEILQKLFARDDFEINCSLALNEALPIAWLQQLQIDTRLLPYLKNNSTFTENILHNLGI